MSTIRAITESRNIRMQPADAMHSGLGHGYTIRTDTDEICLLIEEGQLCCEETGYLWSEEDPSCFVGATLTKVTLTNTSLNTQRFPQPENPEPEIIFGRPEIFGERTNTVFVNLHTDRGTLQFVAYNTHTGAYGHTVWIQCRQLTHQEEI